jgi:hypothetical protein
MLYWEKVVSFVPKYLSAILCTGALDTPQLRVWALVGSVALISVLGVTLFRRARENSAEQSQRIRDIAILALGWLIASILIACASIHFSPRYALPMLVGVAMLLGGLGEAVGLLLRRAEGRDRQIALGAGLGLLILCGMAVHGSPIIHPYPQLAKATQVENRLLASLEERLGSEPLEERLTFQLPRKVSVPATAVDHFWMMAPWTLEAWLELEYPERRFEVRRGEQSRKELSKRFWSVVLIPQRPDTL